MKKLYPGSSPHTSQINEMNENFEKKRKKFAYSHLHIGFFLTGRISEL